MAPGLVGCRQLIQEQTSIPGVMNGQDMDPAIILLKAKQLTEQAMLKFHIYKHLYM